MSEWTPASVVVSSLGVTVTLLLGMVWWLLRRTITENDRAHRDMVGDITGLKTDMAVVKTDITGLKTDMAAVKTDVAELKTDVAELKTDVAELKTDVAELKTDVAGLKTNVAAILTIVEQRPSGPTSPPDFRA